ncbi:MAG: hypothetical protein ACOC0A_03310 [Planctomycetota bacterium]
MFKDQTKRWSEYDADEQGKALSVLYGGLSYTWFLSITEVRDE